MARADESSRTQTETKTAADGQRTPRSGVPTPESERPCQIEWRPPGELRMHALHKILPGPDVESPEWHAFVDGLSAAGPNGTPPLVITDQGHILDGVRRWKGARQLQWEEVGCVRRPESDAAMVIVDSLLGQRHLTKGAKVYLALGLLEDFIQSAEARRIANLRNCRKTSEKPLFLPKRTECSSRDGNNGKKGSYAGLAARLGAGERLVYQALAVRKAFDLAHKFEFQDGQSKTLREHFEPLLLSSEAPIGLGEVLKGVGWFVDANGNPKKQGPPARNSHLHYFQHAWENFARQCGRWDKLTASEREQALAVVDLSVREWPAEVLDTVREVAKEEARRRQKQ